MLLAWEASLPQWRRGEDGPRLERAEAMHVQVNVHAAEEVEVKVAGGINALDMRVVPEEKAWGAQWGVHTSRWRHHSILRTRRRWRGRRERMFERGAD